MKTLFSSIILVLIVGHVAQAQNDYLDYIVSEKNDTIYGVIKGEKLYKTTKDSTYSIDLSKAKSIRKNDVVYNSVSTGNDNNIIINYYGFTSSKTKLEDFIVKSNLDTIFGTIKDPFIGAKYIRTENNSKVKVCKDEAVSYQKENQIYDLKHITKPILSIDKDVFLKRIYKGKANLYEYHILRNDAGSVNPKNFYIIEKDNTLYLISNSNYKQQLVDIFIHNNKLAEKIDNNFFAIENIYLILKYYDLN